jgi:DNA polymerase III epsilon subunit-like protein
MPHAIQFAFSVMDTGCGVVHYNYYLKVPVPIENSHIHGITKQLSDAGVDFSEVASLFLQLYETCDAVVAHNIDFDLRVLRIECARRGIPVTLHPPKHRCTMMQGVKAWEKKKWPTLCELYKHLYGKTLVNLHDASVDVKACLRCYGKMNGLDFPDADALGLTEI